MARPRKCSSAPAALESAVAEVVEPQLRAGDEIDHALGHENLRARIRCAHQLGDVHAEPENVPFAHLDLAGVDPRPAPSRVAGRPRDGWRGRIARLVSVRRRDDEAVAQRLDLRAIEALEVTAHHVVG
jgi:hypothetical protein